MGLQAGVWADLVPSVMLLNQKIPRPSLHLIRNQLAGRNYSNALWRMLSWKEMWTRLKLPLHLDDPTLNQNRQERRRSPPTSETQMRKDSHWTKTHGCESLQWR